MSKKITVEDASADDDAIDIKHDPTDTEQDEWSETLEQAAAEEAKEDAEAEAEAPEGSVSESDDDASSEETEESNEVVETDQTSEEENPPEPEEQEKSEEPEESEPSVDESLNEAVDEVVRDEADTLLAVEDAKNELKEPEKPKGSRFKRAVSWWWQHKPVRYGSIAGLFTLLIALLLIPTTRYQMLNLAGVRVSSSIVIVNDSTSRPLKNIPVKLQGKEARTDDEGRVVFDGLKLGSSQLLIDKRGYGKVDKTIVLGWGSNPLGQQGIVATGTTYSFVAKDWLSGAVLSETEVVAGEDIGQADDAGLVQLVVGEGSEAADAKIIVAGYRDEVVSLAELDANTKTIEMVPARPHTFVSNRNGEYDVYSIDADGKNEKVILKATGKEREIPHIVPHVSKNVVALVSSRDGETNKDQFIYDGLYTLDVASGETYKITRSEQLQVIGWSSDRLLYVAVIEGVSASNSQRSKLISYDLQTKERKEIAAANYFNDVKLVGDRVYYAISSYGVPASTAKLFSAKADGTDRQTEINDQVWTIVRSGYDTLLFNAVDLKWFEKRGSEKPQELPQQPANTTSREYSLSPDGKRAVWSDVRDGKGVLLKYDVSVGKDEVVETSSGLGSPMYWLNDATLIYRISTSQETVDMVLNLDGGEPRKITDVLGNRSRYFY